MKSISRILFISCLFCLSISSVQAQHSVARQWNELLLHAIRNDFARPTVHARNLYHSAIAMYDCWAVFDERAETFFLGKERGGYTIEFDTIASPADQQAAQEEAMSYALYRLLKYRFRRSPGGFETEISLNNLMAELGYSTAMQSMDYADGSPAALGNYLGDQLISFGLTELCNEANDYENLFYEPVNATLAPQLPGNPDMQDPNRWQPLYLRTFIDQSGNVTPFNEPEFLSAEWGTVIPFALQEEDLTVYEREGNEYWVFHDPGLPPYIDTTQANGWDGLYEWNHTLVSVWSSHLDPADSVMWDISPASIGNIQSYPETLEGHRDFYNLLDGGDPSIGYDVNPHTGQPYEPQLVPRADYARVLAEFWADGPDSETPPGHWFTILNYVNDHPEFEKRFQGQGEILDDLEWDVKSYFILAGAVHDAAIAAWGIKGWYDYTRPVSAIRYMAERGQSGDPNLPNYAPAGLPLQEGFVELVEEGDELAGENNEHLGKVKVYAWRGPDYIDQPETDLAGVGWILAENWWPYQRPTFITPPFAGYISGHSTFSRAAAEAMTLLTGDAYFPGGMSEFIAEKNEFLVFEEGPSVDVVLQWATYRDASDQTSLSRIWGGIHPPADDIPGRLIGEVIGVDAFNYALPYFNLDVTDVEDIKGQQEVVFSIYPNPVERQQGLQMQFKSKGENVEVAVMNALGQVVIQQRLAAVVAGQSLQIDLSKLTPGVYSLRSSSSTWTASTQQLVVQ